MSHRSSTVANAFVNAGCLVSLRFGETGLGNIPIFRDANIREQVVEIWRQSTKA